jgi:sugar lactone lactonase YvrE
MKRVLLVCAVGLVAACPAPQPTAGDGGEGNGGADAELPDADILPARDAGVPDSGMRLPADSGSDDAGDAGPIQVPDAGICTEPEAVMVSTIAGSGRLDVNGTGGPAGTTELEGPSDLIVDSAGNVIVVDSGCQVHAIDPQGNTTAIAGNGVCGFADGTGGPSGSAELSDLGGIARDAVGNLFIADSGNNRIRKIDPQGNVTTVAGTGQQGAQDGPGGPGGTAELWNPVGIAFDFQGNLYIADSGNNRIRKLDISGNVTTVAGNGTMAFSDGTGGAMGTAAFAFPTGVAVNSAGTVFVADKYNNRIRAIDGTGNVTTFAGNGAMISPGRGQDGTGTGATFVLPEGIRVDAEDNLYVGDSADNRVRKIDPLGHVTTLAPDGGPLQFESPAGVALDATGNVYVADSWAYRVRKIDTTGAVTTFAGNGFHAWWDGTGGPDGTAEFQYPSSVVADSSGNLYVTDTGNNRIRKIDASGNVTTLAGNGTGSQGAITAIGSGLYFADGTGGPDGTAEFCAPLGIGIDRSGNIYVADNGNGAVRRIDPQGNVTTLNTSNVLYMPSGLAIDAEDNIYVAGYQNIWKIDPGGTVSFVAGGNVGYRDGPGAMAEFDGIAGIAVDKRGTLYLADSGNLRIRKIQNGQVTTLAGNGAGYPSGGGFMDGTGGPDGTAEFAYPSGVAVDSNGFVFVADTGNNRIRVIDPAGNVSTYAGQSDAGFADGPGCLGGAAEFNEPTGVAFDTLGRLLVVDSGNGRVRVIAR